MNRFVRVPARSVFVTFVLLMTLLALAGSASATTFITPNDDNLSIASRAIMRGQVVSIGADYDESTGFVFTYVKVKVQEVLKGNITSRTVVLKELGGEADGHGTVIHSRPSFALQERVVLYLDTWPDGSLRVHDQFLGKYSIARERSSGAWVVERFGLDG